MAIRSSDGRHYQISGPNPLTGSDWGLRNLPIINEDELGEWRDINHCRAKNAMVDEEDVSESNAKEEKLVFSQRKKESEDPVIAKEVRGDKGERTDRLWGQSTRDQLREKRRVVRPSTSADFDPLYGGGFIPEELEDL